MSEKIEISIDEDKKIIGSYNKPEGEEIQEYETTLIIMIHGFPGNKSANNDIYGDIEFILAEKNYHTLRFDFRGCGQSSGKEYEFNLDNACGDLKAVLFWANGKGYKRFIYIADGLGVAIGLKCMPKDVTALAMLWPIFDLRDLYDTFTQGKPISAFHDKEGFAKFEGHKISTQLLAELKNADVFSVLRNLNRPVLVLHGARDKLISVKQLDFLRGHVKSERVEITVFHDGESGLEKLEHRKNIFYQIEQFVEKFA